MSRSLTASARRRALPASSTLRAEGWSRRPATSSSPTASALDSSRRAARPAVGPGRKRGEHVLLGLLPEAGHVLEAALLRRGAQVVERGDAELLVEQPRALGPEPGNPRDRDEAGRYALLELVGGGNRARLEQRIDLLGDRLADARQLVRAAIARHLRDRHAGLPDRLRGVAVGHHAIHDGSVELVQAGELLEGLGYLSVAHGPARVRALVERLADPSDLQRGAEHRAAGGGRSAAARLNRDGAPHPDRRRQLARRHRPPRRPARRADPRGRGAAPRRARPGSAAPTWPASRTRSSTAPSWSWRWTRTSRTTRRTFRA